MGREEKVYGLIDLDGSQPDAWRYVVEVQHAGKPADATGYPDTGRLAFLTRKSQLVGPQIHSPTAANGVPSIE